MSHLDDPFLGRRRSDAARCLRKGLMMGNDPVANLWNINHRRLQCRPARPDDRNEIEKTQSTATAVLSTGTTTIF